MSSRRIATSTLWQLSSQVTMAALSILTVKFVAVGLSKELAGNYNSAYGFLQLFGILADFGLYAVAVREVSRAKGEERQQILGTLIVLRVLILVVALGVALGLVWIVPQWKGTPLPMSVLIASLVPFFTLLAGILRTVFQVEYRMHFVFIAEVTQRIVTVLLIGALIFFGIRGSTDLQHLHMFLFFGGAGAFVLFAISTFYANRLIAVRPRIDRARLSTLFRAAAPFGIAYLCIAIYHELDLTLIALLREDFELQNAYYGFVIRIAGMGFLIPTFLLNSVLPTLSEADARGDDVSQLLGRTFFVIAILGSTALLFAALWSRPIIQLLTTDAYLETVSRPGSDTALRLIAVPLFLNGFILYSFYVLLQRHVWGKLVLTLLAGAALSLALNLWLIPRDGFVGAATTSIVVHIALAAALLPQALAVLPITLTKEHLTKWILFTAGLGAGLWLFAPVLTTELATVAGLGGATGLLLALCGGLKLHKT